MTTDITIPPEAIEAAAKHLPYSQLFEVHAACLAMLRAWPGMVQYPVMEIDCTPPKITLPLPPEKEPS